MNKTQRLGLFFALPLSLGALYLAFRHAPLGEVLTYFRNIAYVWILPAVFFCVLGFVLRAWRWQSLLAHTRKVSFFPVFHPMMIGFMLNSILPGRVGEIVRPVLFAKKESVPFPTTLSTIAAERVLDLVVLLTLLAFVFGFMDMGGAGVHDFGGYQLSSQTLLAIAGKMAWLCLILVLLIAGLQMSILREAGKKMLRGLVYYFPGLPSSFRTFLLSRFVPMMEKILDQVASGFAGLRRPARLFYCLFLSLAIWMMQVLPYWFLAKASSGIPENFLHLIAVMVIVNFFIAIPSVPGFWGIWEAGVVFGLALFGIRGADAAGYALLSHVVLMFPVIFVGLGSALLTGFQFSSATSKVPDLQSEKIRDM
ncbi:lysylphosphatidylglycerol synthase transmembrane domain-containing protein [Desulfobotulus sp.]|jgi:uncharacterized protein (TIRG00374 family)|uniref:lysylphosphatidylglycerol synthase transmembrane domain-containing protein n=1 Tax=Desulfobotulus sp. TaxID=1940337 RepID=UPI002A3629C2|nr:lysylphosphatidylglycerol synthase transmembrane domain-containing protein [Desulfobotulus sp.]MDY0161721.1 lysylphosphatidylglycerol synthase transmembrane domain-containing protein [Desulfobotulus sp.]